MSTVVGIVGAGPGDPGLLTLAARALLDRADVVVHDALVSPEILGTLPAHVERVNVGKRRGKHLAEQEEINQLLVTLALAGRQVVRLKGGDPLLFGRGGEEMQALRAAGVAYVVVPGVSAAIAGPAMAGIPVTHREHAAAVTIVTGHECEELARDPLRWRAMAESGHTLVILMGLTHLGSITRRLIAAGRSAETPVAVVQEATTPRERAVVATLASVAQRVLDAGIAAPAVVVVGDVASLAKELAWRS
ncbi:uroporphyrinogen-III C-methyltransferase [Myxococcota bacterium]|nr:uroporphyrinogen-III C-methyltransferase [Myxococcota bacterium]